MYNNIVRNGVSTVTPNTRIEYDWKLDKKDTLKDLNTKVFIKGVERYVFNYKKQNNQTVIKVKDIKTGNISTITKTGFIPVTIITNQENLLDISY